MVSSGTEAAMSAVRLARAATGRDGVVKFAGAYHGHVDGLLAEAGSGLATQGIPASPGVTAAQAADTIVVPWNDREARRPRRVAEHQAGRDPRRAGRRRTWASSRRPTASSSFLRELADASGALLVLDEVISGFRVARGGAQELYGVDADLTVMGKVLGGGLPAAAYGGRRELMERVAPAGDVYQAGTLSGNPLAVAAGLATLRELDAAAYERLGELTDRLAAGLREAAGGSARPGRVGAAGPGHPRSSAPSRSRDFAGASACDLEAYGALLPRAARARRLPAALPVRGLVRLARPRRGGDRPHGRGRGARLRRGAWR